MCGGIYFPDSSVTHKHTHLNPCILSIGFGFKFWTILKCFISFQPSKKIPNNYIPLGIKNVHTLELSPSLWLKASQWLRVIPIPNTDPQWLQPAVLNIPLQTFDNDIMRERLITFHILIITPPIPKNELYEHILKWEREKKMISSKIQRMMEHHTLLK